MVDIVGNVTGHKPLTACADTCLLYRTGSAMGQVYNGATVSSAPSRDVTQLLIDWNNGNRQALEQLFRWSTTNCAASLFATSNMNGRVTRSRGLRWFTKPTFEK